MRAEHTHLSILEGRIETLLEYCQRLSEENRQLRLHNQELLTERVGLIEKNTLARNRIEAMIARLKTMESAS